MIHSACGYDLPPSPFVSKMLPVRMSTKREVSDVVLPGVADSVLLRITW
jgi:hypothetical protein